MSEPVFSRLRPERTILQPSEMAAWCNASTAYKAAIKNATVLLSGTRNAFDAECRRGYQEGCERASVEMSRRLLAADEAVAKVLQNLELSLPTIVADVVDELFGRLDVETVLPIAIRHTLAKTRYGHSATLRVAPDCMSALRPVVNDLAPEGTSIRLEVDPLLEAGRCVLESELGMAELGVKAQLSVLREHLAAQWSQND